LDDENAYRVIYRENRGQLPPALEFQYLYRSWTEASKKMVAEYTTKASSIYQFSGYVKYYRSKFLEQLVLMRGLKLRLRWTERRRDRFWMNFRAFRSKFQSGNTKLLANWLYHMRIFQPRVIS